MAGCPELAKAACPVEADIEVPTGAPALRLRLPRLRLGRVLPTSVEVVTVEIKTGERTVLSYLLSPIMRYKHDTLRER